MKRIVSRIIIFGWALVTSCVLALILVPKPVQLPFWLPNQQKFRISLIFLVILTTVYGVNQLYAQGMKLVKKGVPRSS